MPYLFHSLHIAIFFLVELFSYSSVTIYHILFNCLVIYDLHHCAALHLGGFLSLNPPDCHLAVPQTFSTRRTIHTQEHGHTNGNRETRDANTNTVNNSEHGKQSNNNRENENDEGEKQHQRSHPTSWWTWSAYLLLLVVSKYTLPEDFRPTVPTLQHVWYYGWVTALSTGLGAAPLLLTHDMGKQMLGVGNAIAAGMMLSASWSLVSEGANVEEDQLAGGSEPSFFLSALARVAIGVVAGLVFILSTKKVGAVEQVEWVGRRGGDIPCL